MSDSTCSPHDAAIAILRDRETALDAEIQGHQRQIELATARRDELLDLIATLSRKPRARKARAAEPDTRAASEAPEEPAPRPSVFAMPAPADAGELAEVA